MLAVLSSLWQIHKGVELPAIIKNVLSVCSVPGLHGEVRFGSCFQGVCMAAKVGDTAEEH